MSYKTERLEMNGRKSKFMIFTKWDILRSLDIEIKEVERVNIYKYLVIGVNENNEQVNKDMNWHFETNICKNEKDVH